MRGRVDDWGRALVPIQIAATPDGHFQQLEAWVDTGFNGELVISKELIGVLGLSRASTSDAVLANGAQVTLSSFTCVIKWGDAKRTVEAVESSGAYPLLGVGLLLGHDLSVSYRTREVHIDS
ncbi:MAG: clan AA aspartic protease [Planctomycetota bacterium]